MLPGLQRMSWSVVFEEAVVVGALANSARGQFQIPETNFGVAVGVRVTAFAGGSITPKFRFGFTSFDAPTATRGVDLRLLGALDASDFGSVPMGANAVAAPNVPGQPGSILPPQCQVLFDSAVGTNLTYVVLAACWYVP